jgi:hypothetical protein
MRAFVGDPGAWAITTRPRGPGPAQGARARANERASEARCPTSPARSMQRCRVTRTTHLPSRTACWRIGVANACTKSQTPPSPTETRTVEAALPPRLDRSGLCFPHQPAHATVLRSNWRWAGTAGYLPPMSRNIQEIGLEPLEPIDRQEISRYRSRVNLSNYGSAAELGVPRRPHTSRAPPTRGERGGHALAHHRGAGHELVPAVIDTPWHRGLSRLARCAGPGVGVRAFVVARSLSRRQASSTPAGRGGTTGGTGIGSAPGSSTSSTWSSAEMCAGAAEGNGYRNSRDGALDQRLEGGLRPYPPAFTGLQSTSSGAA